MSSMASTSPVRKVAVTSSVNLVRGRQRGADERFDALVAAPLTDDLAGLPIGRHPDDDGVVAAEGGADHLDGHGQQRRRVEVLADG